MRRTFVLSSLMAVALAVPSLQADDKDKHRKEWEKERREAVRDAVKEQREADAEYRDAVRETLKDRDDHDAAKEWKEYLKAQRKADKEWSKATKKERKEFEKYRLRHR